MQRVLQNTQSTLSNTFEIDGVATDPSPASALVTVTRADGTPIVTDAIATHSGVGAFTYTLAASDTAELDQLTVAWTSSLGTLTTTVEVVGGFLFTISQARSLKPLDNTTAYSTQAIVEARTLAETALEDLCGVAFVPRYTRETVNGTGTNLLQLRPRVLSVESVTVDGTAYSPSDVVGLVGQPTGSVYNPASRWVQGTGNVTVAYTHGYSSPPPRVSQACLTLAKNWLVKGPLDDRMTSLATDDGTFSLLTPGLRGSYTGIPEVDAVIGTYGMNSGIG